MSTDDKPFKVMFNLDPEALGETIRERQIDQVRRSFVAQSQLEQDHRLHYTVLIAAEGARVRALDRFASAVVLMAVEHVMEGDWEKVLVDIAWCSFKRTFGPPDAVEREQHYAALWSPFRELLEQAYAGRAEGTNGIVH